MRNKPAICLKRIRRIKGGFSFIPHRFLYEDFFKSLSHHELILYFFFTLAADRVGMSWYGDPSILKITNLDHSQLDAARSALVSKELIAIEIPFVQVLALPEHPVELHLNPTENPASRILKSLKGGKND